MPDRNDAALAFLATRRSRPAKTLRGPVPSRDELLHILTLAARTPDHGKLEPWRFVVLDRARLDRLAHSIPATAARLGRGPEDIEKLTRQFADADLAVAVVFSPVASPKIPEIEQLYSAGAVCLALLNAALASGWGANWLSGWASHDATWCVETLGLAPHERIAGFIHIGTETAAPPERPRPDIDAKTDWPA